MREIHSKNASQLSFEQIYRASYKIVLKKQGDELYKRVRQFEEQWFGGVVMPKIRALITKNLVNITLKEVAGITANERRITGEDFLRGLKVAWEDHITTMNLTTDVLMYMDRVYCSDSKQASIFTTSMGLFRDHILREELAFTTADGQKLITFDILNSVLLDQIKMERDGDVIDKNHIRSCVYMLEGLYEDNEENSNDKLYLTVFEPAFLASSKDFYQKEATQLLLDSDCSTWLKQTKKRLSEEENRCQTTISLLTAPKIAKVVEAEMISSHLTEFLAMDGSGIKAMIENDRYEDLGVLYELISRVDPSKEPLKVALQTRVVELGVEINNNIDTAPPAGPIDEGEVAESSDKSKAPKQNQSAKATAAAIRWVDEVLSLKTKFDNMLKNCLGSDLILHTALTKSFSDFINLFSKCSEYVSLFIDDNLKKGIKGKTEAEIDEVLDKAVTLLQYIQDRDMFERYYKKHLARRLLHNKSESADVEKQMISRMKQEIGNSFTGKLEGMFKDVSMSEELTSTYRTHIANLGDLDRKQIDLAINVLSTNYWPSEIMSTNATRSEDGTQIGYIWPSEITTLQESFKSFYLKERNGRKLTWQGHLGSADIKCFFPRVPGKEGAAGKDRRYELTVPTYGMLILLQFNELSEGGSLLFEDIQGATNIPVADLAKQLFTLSVLPKARVLKKDPVNKELPKEGDRFTFNSEFVSKTIKIKAPVMVGQANRVEGDEERKQTEDRNDEHRGNVIDTVVVRIMKYVLAPFFISEHLTYTYNRARKTLTHQALLTQVIEQLAARFKPDIMMMKKRIESLIEREYLERVEDASVPTYNYLA